MHSGAHKLDRFLQDMIERQLSPCVTLVVTRNKEIIYSFINGHSNFNRQTAVPITEKTRFNLGSVTKPVTASLIVKLAEKGHLTLTDPVKKYISEYKFDNVSLFHIMTHTAGYDEKINEDILWPRSAFEIKEYFEKIYAIDGLKYPPDSVHMYCTPVYSILMDVIERITGRSMEEFARAELFDPLEMSQTTYEIKHLEEKDYVLPWKKCNENAYDYLKNTPPTGDTGLYSTAWDMAKFGDMFLNGGLYNGRTIFSRAAVNRMLSEMTGGRFWKTPVFWYKGYKDTKCAFGDFTSIRTVGHAGFSGTLLAVDPQYDTTISFVTNSNDIHDDYGNFRQVCNVVMSSLIE